MRHLVNAMIMTWIGLAGSLGMASSLTVHVGPPSVGSGGSNPVSVPPVNPMEYEVIWVTQSGFESNIAITPGLLFGQRSSTAGGVYVAFGGGLVVSANGGGPGVYSSLGADLGDGGWFNVEFKQAVGWNFSADHMISPYALRIGVTIKM